MSHLNEVSINFEVSRINLNMGEHTVLNCGDVLLCYTRFCSLLTLVDLAHGECKSVELPEGMSFECVVEDFAKLNRDDSGLLATLFGASW